MYTGDWSPEDAAAAGWGPEEQRAYQELYASLSASGRKTFDDKILGDQLRADIRREILGRFAGKKSQDMETAFEYGGEKGKAKADAEYFRRKAEESQNRPGVQVDYSRANDWDYAAGQQRANSLEARGNQMSMADLMARRARGEVPSIAEMQAQRDIQRGIADQSSIAAGARGNAGLALAQQQQAGNSATLTSRVSNDAQINAANERLAAEQAAYGAYAGVRQGDQQGQGADLAGAAAAAQRSQAQAGFDDAQRARNDAREQNMYGNEMGVNTTQLQAQGNKQAVRMGQQQAAIQNQQAKAAQTSSNVMGGLSAGASVLAGLGMMFSDERAKVPAAPPTEPFEAQKAAAMGALDSYSAATGAAGGGLAVEGMSPGVGGRMTGALQRRDEQDAGLYRAKQRTGAPTTWREEKDATAAEARMEREAPPKKPAKSEEKPMTMADRIRAGARGFGALGASLGQLASEQRKRSVANVQPPQLMPYTMRQPSGMQMKDPAPMPPVPTGPLAAEAFGRLNGMNAQLNAGPSVTDRPITLPTMPSDDRTKLAAAWDEGHAAAIADVEKAARATPEEIKKRSEGDDYVPAFAAVRDIKRKAWGEGSKETAVSARMAEQRRKFEAQAPGLAAEQDASVEAAIARNAPAAPSQAPAPVAQPAPAGGEPGYLRQMFGRARAMLSDEKTKDKFPTVPVEDGADANRALRSSAYTYKPEFAGEAGQAPDEVNVGPMTQRMEKSPVAATAVEHDERGMGAIDVPKFTKVLATGLSSAQAQLDQQKRQIDFLTKRLRARGR